MKVASSVKAIFREYLETVIDKDLRLKETKKSLIRLFTKSFENPADQEKFDRMQIVFLQLMESIPVNPLNDLISEGTLTANIISPILYPSRAKQPDMIGNIINNNKCKYEVMFGEITGEGKNNNAKKNSLDLLRLGIFMKDSLNCLIKNTGENRIVFAWQII
ncbi:10766_t:CDS:2, partial [Funneliformis mosseae]